MTITSAVDGHDGRLARPRTIPVDGVSIARTTDRRLTAGPGGTGNAEQGLGRREHLDHAGDGHNAVGTNHVLTITVNAVGGTIDAGNVHRDREHRRAAPAASSARPPATTPAARRPAPAPSTITSAATGTTVVHGDLDHPGQRQSITRTTKTAVNTACRRQRQREQGWVDANIQITPATATNPVGTNHMLTITVNALNGTLDAGPHTATASIVSGPGSFVGSPTCNYTGGARDSDLHGRRSPRPRRARRSSRRRRTSRSTAQIDHPHDQHGREHGGRAAAATRARTG